MSFRYYRLVIGLPASASLSLGLPPNAASTWQPGQNTTSSELVFSSFGTGSYILEVPTGDGQTIDPLTGQWTVGSYQIKVVDAPVSGAARVVTEWLADYTARQQLNNRPAWVQFGPDGSSWQTMVAGYINAIQLVDGITFQFDVGDTRAIETTFKPFKFFTTASFSGSSGILINTGSAYQKRPCFIGGPVSGGFGVIRDSGSWSGHVSAVASDGYGVTIFVSQSTNRGGNNGSLWSIFNGGISSAEAARISALTQGFYQRVPGFTTRRAAGVFNNCMARLYRKATNSTVITPFRSIDERVFAGGIFGILYLASPQTLLCSAITNQVTVAWDTGTLGPTPSVGEEVSFYGYYSGPVSSDWPLYVEDHPVTIAEKQFNELNIPYLSASAQQVRDEIPNVSLVLRITDAEQTLADFHSNVLFAPFGFAVRQNTSGSREFITTRIRSALLPSESITLNDMSTDAGPIWSVYEKDIVNQVTVEQDHYVHWSPTLQVTRPNDDIVTYKDTATILRDDPSFYGTREIKYTIPGQLYQTDTSFNDLLHDAFTGTPFYHPFSIEHFNMFAQGVAYEVFDRFLRGIMQTECTLLTNISSSIGDEIIVTFPQLPNAKVGQIPVSQRGSARIMQIVQRTETPTGPKLKMYDSGDTAQPPVSPSFSLDTASVSDNRRFYTITVTNSGSLITNNYNLRVEMGNGTLQPSGGLQTVYTPTSLPPFITSPQQSAGSIVWARLRSEASASMRPGLWTAWQTLHLKALTPPANLTSSISGAGAEYVSWSLGETDIPVQVFLWPVASPSNSGTLVSELPAGSTQTIVDTSGAFTPYWFGVRHAELLPYNGISTTVSASFTSSDAKTMSTPIHARGFVGGNAFGWGLQGETKGTQYIRNGNYGLAVQAQEFPSFVEFSEATESFAGSGVFSDYDSVFFESSNQVGETVYINVGANDGKAHALRARHIRLGTHPSDWTVPVVVVPWKTVVLDPLILQAAYNVSADDPDGTIVTTGVTYNDGINNKQFVRGKEVGNARHTNAINFDLPFAQIPKVTMQGGILYQPAAVWGSGSQIDTFGSGAIAPDTGSAQIEDFAALGLSTSGFTVQARLRQKAKSGSVNVSDAFIPMNILSGSNTLTSSLQNEATTPISASQAPSNTGNYQVTGSAVVQAHCYVSFGGGTNLLLAVDTDTGAGFVQRTTQLVQVTCPGVGSFTQSANINMSWSDTLGPTDQIRVRVDRFYSQGFIDVNTFYATASFVNYTTAADLYASKTPSLSDFITWVAEGYLG